MKNNPPRKHHYVPECYLKHFKVGKQLFTLDILKVKAGYNVDPKPNHPGKICYFPDYYSIEKSEESNFNLDQHEKLHIESTILRKLENKYGALFNTLIHRGQLTLAESINFVDFIIQVKLRNPYWLKHTLEKKKAEMLNSALESLYDEQHHIKPEYAQIPFALRKQLIDQLKEKNLANPNFSKQLQLYSLVQRDENLGQRNKIFREILIDCEWTVFQAPDQGPYFITSDNPGYTKKRDEKVYNTNFEGEFMFFFPLSPKYCLIISNAQKDYCFTQQKAEKTVRCGFTTAELVVVINNNSIQLTNKLLIAGDAWYLAQIAQINNPKSKA